MVPRDMTSLPSNATIREPQMPRGTQPSVPASLCALRSEADPTLRAPRNPSLYGEKSSEPAARNFFQRLGSLEVSPLQFRARLGLGLDSWLCVTVCR
jgi:hypothetical protein